MEQPMNQAPMQPQQPKVGKWLWITLIIVVVIAGAFFAWYYLIGPGKTVKSSSGTTTTQKTTTTSTPSNTTATDTTTTTDEVTDVTEEKIAEKVENPTPASTDDQTFEGWINDFLNSSTNLFPSIKCPVNVSFKYPAGYTLHQTVSKEIKYQINIYNNEYSYSPIVINSNEANSEGKCDIIASTEEMPNFPTVGGVDLKTINGNQVRMYGGQGALRAYIYNTNGKNYAYVEAPSFIINNKIIHEDAFYKIVNSFTFK